MLKLNPDQPINKHSSLFMGKAIVVGYRLGIWQNSPALRYRIRGWLKWGKTECQKVNRQRNVPFFLQPCSTDLHWTSTPILFVCIRSISYIPCLFKCLFKSHLTTMIISDFTISFGSAFQMSTILCVMKCSAIKLLSHLKPISWCLILLPWEKKKFWLFWLSIPLITFYTHQSDHPSVSCFRENKSSYPISSITEVLQSKQHHGLSPLHSFQHSHILPIVGWAELYNNLYVV